MWRRVESLQPLSMRDGRDVRFTGAGLFVKPLVRFTLLFRSDQCDRKERNTQFGRLAANFLRQVYIC